MSFHEIVLVEPDGCGLFLWIWTMGIVQNERLFENINTEGPSLNLMSLA